MPGQLASLVRSKYPGAYDDMDDATLEQSVLAKYPEYADLADSGGPVIPSGPLPPKLPPVTAQDYVSKFGQGQDKPYYPNLGSKDAMLETGPIDELTDDNQRTVGQALANKTGSFWPTFAGSAAYNIAAEIPRMAAGAIADPSSIPLGLLSAMKGRLPKIAEEVISKEMIPSTLSHNVQTPPPRGLLTEGPPRTGFIGGSEGMAINKPHLYDLGPNNETLNATVLPREFEGLATVPPELPASGVVGPTPSEFATSPDVIPPRDTYTGTGHARPGQSQLPSAPVVFRERVVKQAAAVFESRGVEKSVAQTAAEVATDVPELAPTLQDPGFINKFLSNWNKRKTTGSRAAAKMGSSVNQELSNQLPQLGELKILTDTDAGVKAGTWISQYDNITDGLGEKEFENFVRVIEKKAEPVSDTVKEAVANYKMLDKQISDELTATGAGLKSSDGTKIIPWEPHENYWPHMYTSEFFEALKNNPTDIIARLTEAGKSPLEIDALLKRSKQFGERLIDPQHAREANLPGYRVDRNVYRQHIADMSRRIVEAKNYGPLDLADNESPLMDMIRRSKNPAYSTELMRKILNRGEKTDVDSLQMARKVTGLQAWMHLSTSGISNLNTTMMIPLQTNVKSFLQGLGETILHSTASGEFAKESGALQNIFKEIFAAAISEHKFSPTKAYGIDAGEKFMRTLSSTSGRAYVKQLFNEVKSGGTNPLNLKKLQELTLTSPEDLMKQTALNDMQLKRAAFRTAELSQGLADPGHLPYYWTGSGLANLLTLFHKYQFTQTKIIKDLILENPIRTIPMLLGAGVVAGEITGDAKAVLRGGIRSVISGENKIGDEIQNRQAFVAKKFGLEDHQMVARLIEDVAQSFALGIYADAIEGIAGGGFDILRQFAGSTAGDVMKLFDMIRDTAKGKFGAVANKGVSMVPLVGPPIAAETKPDPYNP